MNRPIKPETIIKLSLVGVVVCLVIQVLFWLAAASVAAHFVKKFW